MKREKITPSGSIMDLVYIIRILRSPDGCLWDRQQTEKTILRYLLDEAYEAADAVEQGHADHVKEELGDLLFMILFLVAIAEEKNEFTLEELVTAAAEKMIRRHPHVFGDTIVKDVEEIRKNWIQIKTEVEKKPKEQENPLGRYPLSMPAMIKAQRMSEKASLAGFDWQDVGGIIDKIEEEIAELKEAVAQNRQECITEETGDLLFSTINLCRFLNIDAEKSLLATTDKFSRRFAHITNTLANRQKTLSETSPEEMNLLWDEAKRKEK